jgi:hypothetical protein
VYIPEEEYLKVIRDKSVHIRIKVLTIKISMYSVEWKQGTNPWVLRQSWIDTAAKEEHHEDKLEAPFWEH